MEQAAASCSRVPTPRIARNEHSKVRPSLSRSTRARLRDCRAEWGKLEGTVVQPPVTDVDGLLLGDSIPEETMGKSTDVSTDYMDSGPGKVSSLFSFRVFL